jgi:hypothetical protein
MRSCTAESQRCSYDDTIRNIPECLQETKWLERAENYTRAYISTRQDVVNKLLTDEKHHVSNFIM